MYLGAVEDLSSLAEHAERNAFAVDVEPDVEHRRLHKLSSERLVTVGPIHTREAHSHGKVVAARGGEGYQM